MNIFVLDEDPKLAAQAHNDQHTVKMILEYTQMLSTSSGSGYAPTHRYHPCTLWAGATLSNWQWLYALREALAEEYTYRYGRTHKSMTVGLRPNVPPGPLTRFVYCGPDEYADSDPIIAYRLFYIFEKSHKYTRRNPPEWITMNGQG